MDRLVRIIDLKHARGEEARHLLAREWLVTNGLGGYASGTISGAVKWRYHGLLIAALPAPLGRVVMLNHLAETIHFPDGKRVLIGGEEIRASEEQDNYDTHYVTEFHLENQMPVWRFEVEGVTIEKSLVLLYGQNTVYVRYRLLHGRDAGLRLELAPSVHFRHHEHAVSDRSAREYVISAYNGRYEISAGDLLPTLRLAVKGENPMFLHDGGSQREVHYQNEAERGYESRGVLWCPGIFSAELRAGKDVTFIASTDSWQMMLALNPAEAVDFHQQRRSRLIRCAHEKAQESPAADLVLAADQFIIVPVGRLQDSARAHAAGDQIRTVIAGYHWFTDWGRDTMISLEGLTLTTGRHAEAGWILRTFAYYIRDGLLPNLFPEGENRGLYHTADATLWFFHALDRYVEVTGDRATLQQILPKLIDVVEKHLHGTRFGIGADSSDGLLRQGAEGYQLTWMDAKVEGWVVTPRRGKAVEINGLWYNALRLLERWLREERGDAAAVPYAELAARVRQSFNSRFWYEDGKYLFDIVDGEEGNDTACRPNQLIAFSLRHEVLDERRWPDVLKVVRERLLTPVGLRSLSPGHPDYKPQYFGDLRARDAAYHQGTVWAWLIGPFIDAWLKVHPDDRAGARRFLKGFEPHLDLGCVGSVNEVFDAEAPFTPRGCIAQAWSVAEVLRAWVKTAE